MTDTQYNYDPQQPYVGTSPYGQQPQYAQDYGQQYAAPEYQQQYAAQPMPQAPYHGAPGYAVSDSDRTLRLIAFVFMVISTVGAGWLILPLAWMIPMTVMSWGIYKGTRANSVAFGVCSLIFCSLVAGICLLISNKER